jgi:hypothetical protein
MTTQTLESPAAGDPHRPPTALRALRTFRYWRKGRPFPGGLLITLAGIELWLAPYSAIGVMIHEGIAGFSAIFIGALLVMFGLTVWFAPAYRFFAGIAAIMLGLIALPTVNLGGFFIGTLLALIGGALSAAWMPRPGWEAPTRGQRRRRHGEEPQEEPGNESGLAVLESEEAEHGPVAAEPRSYDSAQAPMNFPEVEDTGADQHPED